MWNQSRLHSGYNKARKDPAAMMYLSSLFLLKPGLSKQDVKKVLLLQDGRGDVRSFIKVNRPEVSGRRRMGCKRSETVGHTLGGCPNIPFADLKARHDSVVLQITNAIIQECELGKKITLQEIGSRVDRRSKDISIVLDQRKLSRIITK